VAEDASDPRKPWKIQVSIENTGLVAGAEVLQAYISPVSPDIDRPLKELCGFQKVSLEPGERIRLDIYMERCAASYWSEADGSWIVKKGTYNVIIGGSSQDILGQGVLEITETRRWIGL
jgi:beta-glucosidase